DGEGPRRRAGGKMSSRFSLSWGGEQRCRSAAFPAIVLLHAVGRDISFGHITGKRSAIAVARIAAAAAARALQQEALAGLHLVAARGWRLVFLRGGEPDDEPCAASPLAPPHAPPP